MKQSTYDTVARTVPFALYMSFVALLEIPTFLGFPPLDESTTLALYPVKIALVVGALIIFRKSYTDIKWGALADIPKTALSVILGIAIFIIWINLDFPWAVQGELTSYDPTSIESGNKRLFMIIARVVGAAAVVPVMEELFWRSFLYRYLVDKGFMDVQPSGFSALPFIATTVLFGLEHQLWLAGMIAGAAYNFLYLRTGSLVQCILSHAVTNLVLALYVLQGGHWRFW